MIHTLFKKDYEIAKQHYDRALEIDPAIKNFQVENSGHYIQDGIEIIVALNGRDR